MEIYLACLEIGSNAVVPLTGIIYFIGRLHQVLLLRVEPQAPVVCHFFAYTQRDGKMLRRIGFRHLEAEFAHGENTMITERIAFE